MIVRAAAKRTGLVCVDTGSLMLSGSVRETIREWTSTPLHTAIFTHGHVDHCFGVDAYEAEEGATKVRVVAHENLPRRFDRYVRRLSLSVLDKLKIRSFPFTHCLLFRF